MLRTLISTPFPQNIIIILVYAFCVLLSISIHELSHGLAAYASGDNTALTLLSLHVSFLISSVEFTFTQ